MKSKAFTQILFIFLIVVLLICLVPFIDTKAELDEHIHEWIYTVEDGKITAICKADGCPFCDETITYEISTQALSIEYDGYRHEVFQEDSLTEITGTTIGNVWYEGEGYSSHTPPKNAGKYEAIVTLYDNNETILAQARTSFTITKRKIEATVTVREKIYDGTTDAQLIGSVDTGVAGESIYVEKLTGRFETADVGTNKKVIIDGKNTKFFFSEGTFPDNYEITVSNTTAEILPCTITLKADNKSKKEGEADPDLTYTVLGTISGEDRYHLDGCVSVTRAEGETPGNTYDINVSTGNFSNPNYVFETKTAKFVIFEADHICMPGEPVKENNDEVTYCIGCGREMSRNFIEPEKHSHNFSYFAMGNKLTATCSDTECEYHLNPLIFVISATNCSKEYDGQPTNEAVILDNISPVVQQPEIQIVYRQLTGGGYLSSVPPKDAGSYSASVTLFGETICSGFSIAPRDTRIAVNAGKVYDGNTQTEVTIQVETDVANEKITITGLSGSFVEPNAGKGKKVIIDSSEAVINYENADAANYNLSIPEKIWAEIGKKDITIDSVTVEGKVYDGTNTAPIESVTIDTGIGNQKVIIEGLVAVYENTDAATGKTAEINVDDVTYTGLNGTNTSNYNVILPVSAKGAILPANLSSAVIGAIADQPHTGLVIMPEPNVALDNVVLSKGSDFSYSYEDNMEVDTATIVVIGRGNYCGTVRGSFKIITSAAEVIEIINAIGEVELTNDSRAKIDDAKNAYNNLSDNQKALISAEQLKVLTDAEEKYAELLASYKRKKADKEAADKVLEKITAIGEVNFTNASKYKIDDAKNSYNNLSDNQKALINAEQLKILREAETQFANFDLK